MVARSDILRHARDWLGTPYRHQASCKGAGADCLGLIRGLWRELYGAEPETVPAYSADWAEPASGDRVVSEALWAAMSRHFAAKPATDARPGDILLFRMRKGVLAKHLGVLTQAGDTPRFIHAYAGHGVVENCLSRPWASRLVACFELPTQTPSSAADSGGSHSEGGL